MPIKITFDALYKTSLIAGVVIIFISALTSWERYQTTEMSTSGVLEQIILTRLDIISLGEQHNAILDGLELSLASKQNTQSDINYSKSQIEQLKQEEQALKVQIETVSARLKELEALKDNIRNNMMIFIVLTVAGLVLGSLLSIIGCFGWIYHIKIYQERRSKDREEE